MRALKIQPSGAAPVRTITTGITGYACNTYGASLRLEAPGFGDKPHFIRALEVLGREFHNEGIDGLLGRDVLSTLALTINGPTRQFSIHWP